MPPHTTLKCSEDDLKLLESTFTKAERRIGGDGGCEGINGSIIVRYFSKVLNIMVEKCELSPASVLVDVGAGLLRPLLQALCQLRITYAHGVEVDSIKSQSSSEFKSVAERLMKQLTGLVGRINVLNADIGEVGALVPDPTHVYTFWEGFSDVDKRRVAALFRRHMTSMRGFTCTMRALPANTDPEVYMWMLGFSHLSLMHKESVQMSGKQRQSFTSYIFKVEINEKREADRLAKYGSSRDGRMDENVPMPVASLARSMAQAVRKEDKNTQEAVALARRLKKIEGTGGLLPASRTRPNKDVEALGKARRGILGAEAIKSATLQVTFKELGPVAPDILVNGNGGIFSIKRKAMVPFHAADSNKDGNAYVRIHMPWKRREMLSRQVKTLVALAWLPGATPQRLKLDSITLAYDKTISPKRTAMDDGQPYLYVTHKNGNKYDNSVPNLELRSRVDDTVVGAWNPDTQQQLGVPNLTAEQREIMGPAAAIAVEAVAAAVEHARSFEDAVAAPSPLIRQQDAAKRQRGSDDGGFSLDGGKRQRASSRPPKKPASPSFARKVTLQGPNLRPSSVGDGGSVDSSINSSVEPVVGGRPHRRASSPPLCKPQLSPPPAAPGPAAQSFGAPMAAATGGSGGGVGDGPAHQGRERRAAPSRSSQLLSRPPALPNQAEVPHQRRASCSSGRGGASGARRRGTSSPARHPPPTSFPPAAAPEPTQPTRERPASHSTGGGCGQGTASFGGAVGGKRGSRSPLRQVLDAVRGGAAAVLSAGVDSGASGRDLTPRTGRRLKRSRVMEAAPPPKPQLSPPPAAPGPAAQSSGAPMAAVAGSSGGGVGDGPAHHGREGRAAPSRSGQLLSRPPTSPNQHQTQVVVHGWAAAAAAVPVAGAMAVSGAASLNVTPRTGRRLKRSLVAEAAADTRVMTAALAISLEAAAVPSPGAVPVVTDRKTGMKRKKVARR